MAGDGSDEWFDVFFDLVFAVAVTLSSERVAHDPSLGAWVRSIGYLLPIWWIWISQTVFAMRFDASSPAVRSLAILQIIGAGIMSTQLVDPEVTSARFPLGFVIARLSLLATYAWVARGNAAARTVLRVYVVGFGLGAAIWAVSIGLPPALRPVAWTVGLAVDYATPWVWRSVLAHLPLDARRLPARVGLFVSLLLVVAIEGIVRGLAANPWTATNVTGALLSFSLVVVLWWLYAARVNRADMSAVIGSGQPYLYSHFPVLIGADTFSIGLRGVELGEPGLGWLGAGLAMWLLGIVLIRRVVQRHAHRFASSPFLLAAAAVGVLAVLGRPRPLAAVAAIAVVMNLLLVVEVRHGRRHASGG